MWNEQTFFKLQADQKNWLATTIVEIQSHVFFEKDVFAVFCLSSMVGVEHWAYAKNTARANVECTPTDQNKIKDESRRVWQAE